MLTPGKIILFCCLLGCSPGVNAQSKIPYFFFNTDVVYAAELIPTVGIEHFFLKGYHLRSWHIDAGYQFSYSNQFGFILFNGDDLSLGVYKGPVAKFGYSYYTKWRGRKWINYFSPTLGIKYLWYDPIEVYTGDGILDPGSRLQSEKCISLIPQFYVGQKRSWGHFCYDYYFGLQAPVKFRDKRIYQEVDNNGVTNPDVPYTTRQVSPSLDFVFGIKLGYNWRTVLPALKEPDSENDDEDTPDKKD